MKFVLAVAILLTNAAAFAEQVHLQFEPARTHVQYDLAIGLASGELVIRRHQRQ